MILDKEDHKIILLEMIKTTTIPGRLIDAVVELREAITTAQIEQIENKKEEQNAP